MQLKNQVEWALHCCVILAGLSEGRYLPTKALAEFHGVPKEYLSKAMQGLSQAGIVEGTLGPTGGYRLAKPLEKISFLDIVEAVEGKSSTFVCTEIRRNNPCRPSGNCKEKPCAVARIMWEADQAWRTKLRNVVLAEFVVTLEDEIPSDLREKSAAWIDARS